MGGDNGFGWGGGITVLTYSEISNLNLGIKIVHIMMGGESPPFLGGIGGGESPPSEGCPLHLTMKPRLVPSHLIWGGTMSRWGGNCVRNPKNGVHDGGGWGGTPTRSDGRDKLQMGHPSWMA